MSYNSLKKSRRAALYLLNQWPDLDELAHIHHWGDHKEYLDFGNLNLMFEGISVIEN